MWYATCMDTLSPFSCPHCNLLIIDDVITDQSWLVGLFDVAYSLFDVNQPIMVGWLVVADYCVGSWKLVGPFTWVFNQQKTRKRIIYANLISQCYSFMSIAVEILGPCFQFASRTLRWQEEVWQIGTPPKNNLAVQYGNITSQLGMLPQGAVVADFSALNMVTF